MVLTQPWFLYEATCFTYWIWESIFNIPDFSYWFSLIGFWHFSSVQFSHSVMSDSCELIDCSTPGFPVHHQLPELAQTHVHILTYTPMVKNLPANARDVRNMGSIPGSGRSPGGEHGNPLQYSCLENPMNRGAWQDAVHRITKSWTWLKRLCSSSNPVTLPL